MITVYQHRGLMFQTDLKIKTTTLQFPLVNKWNHLQ